MIRRLPGNVRCSGTEALERLERPALAIPTVAAAPAAAAAAAATAAAGPGRLLVVGLLELVRRTDDVGLVGEQTGKSARELLELLLPLFGLGQGLDLGRRLVIGQLGAAKRELGLGEVDIGRRVLERRRRARVLVACPASDRDPRIRGLRTPVSPFLGAFTVPGHGALLRAQRVSRCAVWHLHQRQYFRS